MDYTNNLLCSSCCITATHLKRPVKKNIEDTIRHIITTSINYISPSDRILGFYVEGVVTSKNIVSLHIEINPYYLDISNSKNSNQLRKSIIFKTEISMSDLTEELTKELQWVMDYFGFTIMYITKSFKHIVIEKSGKGYTLEYTK